MSAESTERIRILINRLSEFNRLPDELARACKQLDEITRAKQEHARGRSLTDHLEIARALLNGATDLRPDIRSPYWLHMRFHELRQVLEVEHGRDPSSGDRWAEVWERFEAALVMSVSDVLKGRECDLSGRLILWRPPVRRSA